MPGRKHEPQFLSLHSGHTNADLKEIEVIGIIPDHRHSLNERQISSANIF